jgi:DNA-binding transcriptional regulator YhcF (GntR family)
MKTPVAVAAQEAIERHVNEMTEVEMQTIAKAVRILSLNGLLEIKLGRGTIIPASENRPTYGPLTFAEVKATGEFLYLLADSSIPIRLEELEFRMTLKTKAKTAKAGK